MLSRTAFSIALVLALLTPAWAVPNPPVDGSFGDPLRWCPAVSPSASTPTQVTQLRPSVCIAMLSIFSMGFGAGTMLKSAQRAYDSHTICNRVFCRISRWLQLWAIVSLLALVLMAFGAALRRQEARVGRWEAKQM